MSNFTGKSRAFIEGYHAAMRVAHEEAVKLHGEAETEHARSKPLFGILPSGDHHAAMGKSRAAKEMGRILHDLATAAYRAAQAVRN